MSSEIETIVQIEINNNQWANKSIALIEIVKEI